MLLLAGHQWLKPVILATQEDGDLKPAWENSSQDPILKIPNTKRAGGVAQGVGPEFKARYRKTKKKCYCEKWNVKGQILNNLDC
jgi:hypothetical protein